jgi:hypothetical protein
MAEDIDEFPEMLHYSVFGLGSASSGRDGREGRQIITAAMTAVLATPPPSDRSDDR